MALHLPLNTRDLTRRGLKRLSLTSSESRSYSQSGEDMVISFIFGAMGIDRPSYLDIGAHHPTYLSNTAKLYRSGSRGINVEPDPSLFGRFVSERPRDINLNIGIAASGPYDELEFFVMDPPTLNTFSELEAKSYVAEGYSIVRTVQLRVESLAGIIEAHHHGAWPDFLSIDVEGLDFEILESADFSNDGPVVICAETISFSSSGNGVKRPEIARLLEGRGYFLYADTHINSIFVKESTWRNRTGEGSRRDARVRSYVSAPATQDPYLRMLFDHDRPIVVFDVGACEGEDSIRYERMFPRAQVFAFEPLPVNQELCHRHFDMFDTTRVTLLPLALSDTIGEAEFHVSSGRPEGAPNDGWDYGNKSSSLLPPDKVDEIHPWLRFAEPIAVQTDTIDEVVVRAGLSCVDFIHMDVQGAELMALRGGTSTLKTTTAIWLEVEATPLYKDQPLKIDVEQFMAEHGFVRIVDAVDGVSGDQFYVNRALVSRREIVKVHGLRSALRAKAIARRSVRKALRRVRATRR